MAIRYSNKTKREVVEFVRKYDKENGRGGKAAAKKKFKINAITITKWCSFAPDNFSDSSVVKDSLTTQIKELRNENEVLICQLEEATKTTAQVIRNGLAWQDKTELIRKEIEILTDALRAIRDGETLKGYECREIAANALFDIENP